MNIYELRWHNAVRTANKINALLASGHLVFDENGDLVLQPFKISRDEIKLPIGDRCAVLYFLRDPEFDNGAHTKIEEYNNQFSNWKAVDPKYIFSI